MERDVLEKKIIRDLANHRRRNDIIQWMCREMHIKWSEAEKLFNEIELSRSGEVERRQLSMIGILGLMAVIGGVALMGFVVMETLHGLVILLLRIPIPYLGNIFFFALGFLIALGGVIGLIRMRRK